MRSFVMGSYAYGTPTAESDIDLCVFVDSDTAKFLAAKGVDLNKAGVRFGQLNLILCKTEEEFERWKTGTEELKAMAPVSRDEAIAHFQSKRLRGGSDGE